MNRTRQAPHALPRARHLLASAVLVLASSSGLHGQGLGWHGRGALSGNIFFGNTRQLLLSTGFGLEHVDSALQNRNEVRVNYGEATSDVDNRTFVSKRSWLVTSSLDVRPFTRINPFVQALLESSLEKKISRRYSAGAGTRINFVRTPATEAILSLGALVERTRAIDAATGDPTTSLARGLASFRAKRALGTRVALTSESVYRPALQAFGRYTLATDNSAIVALRQNVSFTVSVRDSYDSEARSRGARKNNDGELLFGVLTTF